MMCSDPLRVKFTVSRLIQRCKPPSYSVCILMCLHQWRDPSSKVWQHSCIVRTLLYVPLPSLSSLPLFLSTFVSFLPTAGWLPYSARVSGGALYVPSVGLGGAPAAKAISVYRCVKPRRLEWCQRFCFCFVEPTCPFEPRKPYFWVPVFFRICRSLKLFCHLKQLFSRLLQNPSLAVK